MRWHDTCTIQRGAAVVDPYTGEDTGELDWTTPTTTTGVACSIQPRASREASDDQETVVAGWYGYFPAGTDLTSADRILWRGMTLTVDGEVAPWVRGNALHHYEAPLQRIG